MRHVRVAALFIGLLAIQSRPAAAQPRPVEIGVGAGGAATWWSDGIAGGHVSVSVPKGNDWAVEAFIAAGREGAEETMGLYGAQARYRLSRASRTDFDMFLTFGIGGVFWHSSSREYRYTRPDGASFVDRTPADTFVSPPIAGFFGAGVQRIVTPHLAVRLDAQAITAFIVPVGLRATASVAVPIGRFTRVARPDRKR